MLLLELGPKVLFTTLKSSKLRNQTKWHVLSVCLLMSFTLFQYYGQLRTRSHFNSVTRMAPFHSTNVPLLVHKVVYSLKLSVYEAEIWNGGQMFEVVSKWMHEHLNACLYVSQRVAAIVKLHLLLFISRRTFKAQTSSISEEETNGWQINKHLRPSHWGRPRTGRGTQT